MSGVSQSVCTGAGVEAKAGMIFSLIDALPRPLSSSPSAIPATSGSALAGKSLTSAPFGGIEEVAGMRAGMASLGPLICGHIALRARRIVLQVARRRHRQPRCDHAFAEVLPVDLDGADRATVALLARQADRAASGLQQLRRIILRRLATRPAAVGRAAELPLLEGVNALSRVFCDRKIRYDK